jgi:hypothetical protein
MESLKEDCTQTYIKSRLKFIANKINNCLKESLSKIPAGHVMNPKALQFLPGAKKHGITRKLLLNYAEPTTSTTARKRRLADSVDLHRKRLRSWSQGYIDWLQIDSDTESYNFEDETGSDSASIVWLGDSPPELVLNHLGQEEQSLPR